MNNTTEIIQKRLAFLRELEPDSGYGVKSEAYWMEGYAYAIANEIAFLEDLLKTLTLNTNDALPS